MVRLFILDITEVTNSALTRLRPHESSETDIVLLGHSMGGIVSADVVLLPSRQTQESFAHRILGTINFDTPFLGMHPGVVVSGISSLFRPADATPQPQLHDGSSQALLPAPDGDYFLGESQSNGSMIHQDDPSEYSKPGSFSGISPSPSAASKSIGSPLSGLSIPISDPNYNPPFENDVVLPVRKGWDNALHFVMKHSDDLSKATKEYVTSHLKFGGTMADYKGLQARYRQIRALEDVNDSRLSHRRVRFLNYYTASTGRIRKPKPLPPTIDRQAVSTIDSEAAKELDDTQDLSPSRISPASSPDPTHESLQISQRERSNSASSNQDLGHIDPIPMPDNDRLDDSGNEEPDDDMPALKEELTGSQVPLKLPPIPPEPETPEDFKPDAYEDKDIRKLAEKEYARKMKAYLRGVRDREKAISDRQKMIEKREKKARKAQEKSLKDEKKLQAKEEKERKKQLAVEEKEAAAGTVTHVLAESTKAIDEGADSADISATRREDAGKGKAKRERKFCMLPSKDDNGQRDPAWIRVFMEGVDEVGAHCGLFFADRPHYAQFVTDVSEKLKEWVERDKMVRDER